MAILSVIWGSSFILMKKGLLAYTPDQVAALRVGITGLAFLPWFVVRVNKIPRNKWSPLFWVGIFGTAIPYILFPIAQTQISSSMSGILNSLTPLFALVLGVLAFGRATNWYQMLGILLGLLGAVLLIGFSSESNSSTQIFYSFLAVLAAFSYAISANIVGAKLQDVPSWDISIFSFVVVGVPAMLYWLCTDIGVRMQTTEGLEALGYITLLALGGTVVASLFFFKLVQMTSPVFASTVSYVAPVIAVGWGVLDGESVGWLHLVGMIVIFAGVYLTRIVGGKELKVKVN